MIAVHPYLTLENTKEALMYYEEVFGAKNIVRMPVSPEQAEQFEVTIGEAAEWTMHGQFEILGTTIMASDNFQKDKISYTGISILLDLNSEDEEEMVKATAFWEHVSKSNKVSINMPFEEQFWGGSMGDLTDKYGIRWMLHAQPYSKQN